jgi:hypothetical protein
MNKRTVVTEFLKGYIGEKEYPTTYIQMQTLLYRFMAHLESSEPIEEEPELSSVHILLPELSKQESKDAFNNIEVRFGNNLIPVRKMHLTSGGGSNPELLLHFSPEHFIFDVKAETEIKGE